MKCKLFISVMLLFFLFAGAAMIKAGDAKEEITTEVQKVVQKSDSTATAVEKDSAIAANPESQSDKIIAYYFHGNRRCATCKKLEAYSTEAVQNGFEPQLKSGTLEWHVVNIDEEPNKHFVDDYQLYTKSVIVSHVVNGKETEWKNLEKIWELVGDQAKFTDYVQSEVRAFFEKK